MDRWSNICNIGRYGQMVLSLYQLSLLSDGLKNIFSNLLTNGSWLLVFYG